MVSNSDILITYVLDRTGSMDKIWDATRSGFKEFVNQQKEVEGQAYLSLVAFDSESIDEVYSDILVDNMSGDIPDDIYPRAMTPLLDAVAKAIRITEQNAEQHNWDGKVLIAINTDGYENYSTEHDLENVRSLVERKQNDGWEFVFLGAGLDAFAAGTSMGIRGQNTMSYSHDPASTRSANRAMTQSVASYRTSDSGAFEWEEGEE